MINKSAWTLLPIALLCACDVDTESEELGEASQAAKKKSELVRSSIPDQDPGAPFYARIGFQFLETDGYIVIPFYRDPACIPADFNLLEFFHFPGPGGPGAFGCTSTMYGYSETEPDAPPFTFPKHIVLEGDAVPFYIVDADAFWGAADDGNLTIGELQSLDPITATATDYEEDLYPRLGTGEHYIEIKAKGHAEDGRRFSFKLKMIGDEFYAKKIQLKLK